MFQKKIPNTTIFIVSAILSLIVLASVSLVWHLRTNDINQLLNQIRGKQMAKQIFIRPGNDPLISHGIKPGIQTLIKPLNNANDPWHGSEQAKVTIVEFSDFQCEYCATVQENLKTIADQYPQQIKFIWKDFPLTDIYHEALPAAIAARCAQQQNKFWEYHDLLFANQDELLTDNYRDWAEQLDLDIKQFNQCFDNQETFAIIKNNFQEGIKLQLSGTPHFYINEQEVLGSASLEDLKRIIDIELGK